MGYAIALELSLKQSEIDIPRISIGGAMWESKPRPRDIENIARTVNNWKTISVGSKAVKQQ